MKAGIAINPHTPVSLLQDVIQDADAVCVMTVNPGFGGQTFISHSFQKIRELRDMIDAKGLQTLIQIDGGVSLENAADILAAGADVLVAGNTVFSASDPPGVIKTLAAAGTSR